MVDQLTDSECDKSILHSMHMTVTANELSLLWSHCVGQLSNTGVRLSDRHNRLTVWTQKFIMARYLNKRLLNLTVKL